ncbi:hypothetical protein [Actinacidiphila glaucinigra]|uniref:hypothetical protein n=1 Tax=Actinacidiphila glaucinigra TaxID=235986 RepID=UPI0035DF3F1B
MTLPEWAQVGATSIGLGVVLMAVGRYLTMQDQQRAQAEVDTDTIDDWCDQPPAAPGFTEQFANPALVGPADRQMAPISLPAGVALVTVVTLIAIVGWLFFSGTSAEAPPLHLPTTREP